MTKTILLATVTLILASPLAGQPGGMLVDDLGQRSESAANKTSVVVGEVVALDGYSYGGYRFTGGFGIIPGGGIPAYASIQPVRDLPNYIEMEMKDYLVQSRNFGVSMARTGIDAQHQRAIRAESGNSQNRIQAQYMLTGKWGILEEQIRGRRFDGSGAINFLRAVGIDQSRAQSILNQTLGQVEVQKTARTVIGILILEWVDLNTKQVVEGKSTIGIAAISWEEFSGQRLPAGFSKVDVRHLGAGKLANSLVKNVFLHPTEREELNRVLEQQSGQAKKPGIVGDVVKGLATSSIKYGAREGLRKLLKNRFN